LEQSAASLEQLAGGVVPQANRDARRAQQDFDRRMRDADRLVKQSERQFQEGNRLAERAIAEQKRAESTYQQGWNEDAATRIAAINRRFHNDVQMAAKGINPATGVPMGPEEAAHVSHSLRMQAYNETDETLTAMRQAFRQTMANIQQQTAQVVLEAGRFKQGSAQGLAGLGTMRAQLAGSGLEGVERITSIRNAGIDRARALRESAASMRQMATTIRTGTEATAFQMQLAGMERSAEILRAYPESLVSQMSSILNLLNLSLIPGVANMRPINMPMIG
jgi:hypothetical protein